MKSSGLTQYISGFIVASLLIFLFFQSQIDNTRHEKTLIELLTLMENDSQLRQQIIELHIGHKKNYGGLVAHQQNISQIMRKLLTPDSPLFIDSSALASSQLGKLQQSLAQRFDAIETFKSENAVLRNSLYFLPKQIQDLVQTIQADPQLERTDKLEAQALLYRLNSEVLLLDSEIDNDYPAFDRSLTPLQQDLSFILDDYIPKVQKIITQARLISRLQQSLTPITRQASSSSTARLTSQLYDQYNADFSTLETQANQYRIWLFIVSMALLLYLAYTFLRLQKTSLKLADSIQELEFHKYAIDEHAIVSITDVKGRILYANQKFCDISQYSRDELVGHNHRIVRSDVHDNAYFKEMWKTIANGKIWHGVFANRAKDGSIYWVDSTVLPRIGRNGKPYQYIGIRTDITAQKKAEQEVQLLARFPAENPDPVMRVDHQGKLLFANHTSNILLKHWRIGLHDAIPDKWIHIILRVLLNNEQEEHEVRIDNVYFSIIFSPIQSEQYVNLYARDISAIKRAEKHLNYQATHDLLTSLSNRYAFEMRLEDTLVETRQHHITSILLYIDLDQFKIVNDTCGHIAGDELLRQVSHLFEESIRDSDILARLGGDEFGIILNNCELQYGEEIAAKILTRLHDFRFLWDDKSFAIGASIGLVEIDQHSDSIVTLMGDADVACYAAKDAGRNRLQVFRNDQAIAQQRDEIQWASRIPAALSQNQFELFCQLIKPLNPNPDSKRHYELLIRLRGDNGELIPPGAFIPAAERYNLMHSIDFWVVTHAIETLGKHLQKYPQSDIRIGINLSGQSIGNEHLLDYIPQLIEQFALDPAFVTFEITETAAISNLTAAVAFIRQLKENGHYFALDDFGSGLSSFSYLKNLPVDFLKIDGAFVKDILQDPIDAAMVQAINQIGHVMNIGTIAEFVENAEVETRLKLIGIDYAQGYHIEKPRPFSEVLEQDAQLFEPDNSQLASE